MSFYTAEYKHLVQAERAIASALKPRTNEAGLTVYPEPRDIASLSGALTRVIDQKRIMRGQGTPKPVDARNGGARNVRSVRGPQAGLLIDAQVVTQPARTLAQDASAQPPTNADAQAIERDVTLGVQDRTDPGARSI